MAGASAAMLRPGVGDPHYYNTQKIYDTEGAKTKRWPSRLKMGGSSAAGASRAVSDRTYDMYGTISTPGGSSLSKSMKYAETWLYGTLRTHPLPHRPSLFNAYSEIPGPVLISTPQKPAQNYAVILCSCPDYLNGTKKSSLTKVSICKKCKGSRLPLTIPEGPRVMLGGTVRGSPVARDTGIMRAGTVKVQNIKQRPSILKSQGCGATDPYDIMRRSRLVPPHETRIGSQFSAVRTRAKSISPSRKNGKLSPCSETSRKNRSKSVGRVNGQWIEDSYDSSVESKRSILTSDVNAYELMNTRQSKSQVEIEFDDDYNLFDTVYTEQTQQKFHSSHSSYKDISGQRIRIIDETKTCTVEEVCVYDPVNIKSNIKNFDLKTQELSASLPSQQTEKHKKKLNSYYNVSKKIPATSTPITRAKLKINSPKRPPRKMRVNRTDDDSESDNQKEMKKNSEKRPAIHFKNVRYSGHQNDTIKSILKKPRISFNETLPDKNYENLFPSNEKLTKGTQFYLPTPTTENHVSTKNKTLTARKRVQFLVENDDTKIIYTAEFNFTENKICDNINDGECIIEEIEEEKEVNGGKLQLMPPRDDENKEILNICKDSVSDIKPNDDISSSIEVKKVDSHDCISNDLPKVVILRRSESERLHANVATTPKFLDSMALRVKPNKLHTSQVFLSSTSTLTEEKNLNTNLNNDKDETFICAVINSNEPTDSFPEDHKKNYQTTEWPMDVGNLSDNSDITEEILRSLRKSISNSPEPPPRKSKDQKQMKSRKNNYVKTRFVRTNSASSTSDEYSDNNDVEQKTVLRVKPFDSEQVLRKINIDKSYEECDSEPRRTSIQINGDDCYSTMNVSHDAPIYLSSVVVKDDYSHATYQTGSTVTITINTPEKKMNHSNSNIYIGSSTANNSVRSNSDDYESMNMQESESSDKVKYVTDHQNSFEISDNPVEAVKNNLIPHVCGKIENCNSDEITNDLNLSLAESENNKDSIKFGFVAKLLDDPLLGHLAEGLDSELVTKLIEKSLIRLQENKVNGTENNSHSKETVNNLIENSLTQIKLQTINTTQSEVAKDSTDDVKNDKITHSAREVDNIISSEPEENGCSAPYESMEYESGILGISSDLEPLSDCYNASASELSTEDDGNARSKLYQMLVDAALCEIEATNSPDDDHVYESIRLNSDPIYEEIGDIPPPLPTNPPPSSLLSLDDDKKSCSRSIFEGASKYDILSYLVDAKERGIDSEETYITNYAPECDTNIERTNDKEVTHDRSSSDMCSNASQLSNGSDSSEDNSLVISSEIIEKAALCKKTSAEIERNDSGVGSETSKSSRSRWQGRCSPSNSIVDKESPIHLCEDCDSAVETQITESGAMYAPLVCRKCAKKRAERKEIIMEIVETEEKYGRDLQIILEEFYKPMLVAGLLTQEQLSAIFLNVEELIENNQTLSEKMRDALEIAIEQGDEDLLTVNIGKLIIECSHMLSAFQGYCVKQAGAALLLAGLEKEKELLRIFLRVSQMENAVLRRMNLNSFLMVPVQRVTKYPLLLSRLHRATASCATDREDARLAQRSVEERLAEMNAAAAAAAAAARDVPLWRRLAAARRTARDLHVADIRLRKMAVDVLEWNHDEARFAMEGKLLFTQPNDNNWRKGRTIKLTPINALLVTNGKPTEVCKPTESLFPRASGVREAALLLVREKAGRYTLHREPLYLDRCVVAADAEPDHFFEVHEITTKDSFIFKSEESTRTRTWYRQLQFHAQGVGAWRKRRNALANIMINPMLTRN